MKLRIPAAELIGPDTPLRLSVAAAISYPDGSVTAAGLRRESRAGRLAIERTAGKDYTTLARIERMRELCQREAEARGYGRAQSAGTGMDGSHTPPCGSSETEAIRKAQDALDLILEEQSKRCADTSPASTASRRRRAHVTPIRSPSLTS